jgi:hypothetical protein
VVTTANPKLSTEVEAALLLSTPTPREADQECLRDLLGRTMDWSRILGILFVHRTAGTAWLNLVGLGFEALQRVRPDFLLPTLELAYRAQCRYAADQLTRTTALMRLFDDAGIECVLLKGGAVARMAYRDPGMRFFGDNDLLFHRADLGRVGTIMKEHGYVQGIWDPGRGEIVPASRREVMLHAVHSHETYPYLRVEPDAQVAAIHEVDVHFSVDLLSSNNTDDTVADILARRIRVDGDGGPVWTPHQEDMFAFVAVHLEREATHISEVATTKDLLLYKLLDLLAMLENTAYPVDHDAVVRRAEQLGLTRELHFGLFYVDQLYPGRVPPELLDRTRPADTAYLHEVRDRTGPLHTWRAPLPARFFDGLRQAELADTIADWTAAAGR